MPGPLPLSNPYIPGVPGAGLDPGRLAEQSQQNFDDLARAVGDAPVVNAGDAAGGALSGTYPNPALAVGTVLQLAATGTTRKVAFGTASVSYSASNTSSTATVTHGLGTTPSVVVAIQSNDGDGRIASVGVSSIGSTTFVLQARDWAGSTVTKTSTLYWVAIG